MKRALKAARDMGFDPMDKWVRVIWQKRAYKTREAQPSYAPNPDWSKLPPFNELVRLALGEHGIIRDDKPSNRARAVWRTPREGGR